MKRLLILVTVLRGAYFFLKIMGSLLLAWLILGWNVRRARKSFESELTKEGMSKENAERLSHCFLDLKDEIIGVVKKGFGHRRRRDVVH